MRRLSLFACAFIATDAKGKGLYSLPLEGVDLSKLLVIGNVYEGEK